MGGGEGSNQVNQKAVYKLLLIVARKELFGNIHDNFQLSLKIQDKNFASSTNFSGKVLRGKFYRETRTNHR